MDELMPTSPEMDRAEAAVAEEEPPISDVAYLEMQNRVELLSRLLLETSRADLDGLIRRAEHLDVVGPFIDPTAWMGSRSALRMVIDHARALAEARRSILAAAHTAGAKLPEGVDR